MSRLPPTDLRFFREDPAAPDLPEYGGLFLAVPDCDPPLRTQAAEEAVHLLTEDVFRPLDGN